MNPSIEGPRNRHRWIPIAVVVMLGLAVPPFFLDFGPVSGGPIGLLAAVVATAVSACIGFLASRVPGRSGRLRQALLLQAASMLLVSGGNLVRLLDYLGVPMPTIPSIGEVSEFIIWLLGFAALARIPLRPIARENRWRVATDIAISGLGLMLILAVIWMLPGSSATSPGAQHRLMFYNVMELGNLFLLNLILVRGTKPMIRHAVGWLVIAVIADTIYSVGFQYSVGREIHNPRLFDSAFFVDTLFYLIAALYFLWGNPVREEQRRPSTLLEFINPLPFFVVFAVGALLVLSALHGFASSVTILSVGIVVISMLLLLRVVVSSRESLMLAQEAHAIEQRAQSQRVNLMMRLSGGVSHVINNLMTVVLANAELMRATTPKNVEDTEHIELISSAARDAGKLAARLALCSGGRITGERRSRLSEAVLAQEAGVVRLLGRKRDVVFEVNKDQGGALVASSDVEAIMSELVTNAGEATYHAGKITVRVSDAPLPPGLAAGPSQGLWSLLEVSDTGRGIEKGDLPFLTEPFFTSRPTHEGRGLGLSVVQGIVSRYEGHLLIDSEPASGARVRIFLPVNAANPN